jgi:hypothetical protein
MIHISCGKCSDWEIVGPGHPAVRQNPGTGQHEFFDRTAVLKNCTCPDDGNGSRPLHFTFMAATGTGA